MPTFEITSPDGAKYRVTAPDGASQQDVLDRIRAVHTSSDMQAAAKPDYGKMSAGEIATSALKAVPGSAVQFGKDIAQPVMHPIDTATNIGNIGKGVLQKLGIMEGKDAEPYADAVGKFLVDRYGSGEAIKKTIATDPVGMAADLSTVLSGGGTAAARVPGVAGKLGKVAATAGRLTDPLTTPLKVAGKVGSEILGVTTGVGSDAIKTAFKAGQEGGEAGRAFREQLTGAAPAEEIVQDAQAAVGKLRQERGALYRQEMAKVGGDKTILSFNELDTAVNEIANVKNYKGQSLSPSTENIRTSMIGTIEEWKDLKASEFHTAEGFDALKQKLGDIRDATQFGTPERKVADEIYHAARKTIVDQVPEYAKIMKGYEQASAQIKEIEQTLSAKPNASIDTQMRKLLSALRDNVNTNYGKRKELVAFLARSGATHLLEKIAGRTLSAVAPRGLARALVPGELAGAGAAAFVNPLAAASIAGTLAASSPALVGAGAYGAGSASRLGLRGLGQGSRLLGLLGR
jgi:hypothetical protein